MRKVVALNQASEGQSALAASGDAAQPSEGAQPGPKKPGKKPRDLLKTVANLMTDFESATPSNDAYFGKDWAAHGRYCKRLQDDIDKQSLRPPRT